MRKKPIIIKLILIALLLLLAQAGIFAQEYRFPQPEFSSGYEYPENKLENPASPFWDYLDAALLLTALVLAVLISYKFRRRWLLVLLMLASILYFGFIRKGCFCPIGTIQPVVAALFNPDHVVPLVYVIFFTLPLLFALFWGRVFCSGVCPLGALQDMLHLKTIRLPRLLSSVLEMLPAVFLALAIVSAITESEYLICSYDPFVPLFRGSFGSSSIIYSVIWLGAALFIARPYCRFLCPYGFLLRIVSIFSRKRLTTSPEKCISCRLCENSCPVSALDIPGGEQPAKEGAKKRLFIKVLLAPLFIGGGALWGYLLSPHLAQLHPDVSLAAAFEKPTPNNELARKTFLATEDTVEQLQSRVEHIRGEWAFYAVLFGGLLGLLLAFSLIFAERRRQQEEYLPSKDRCLHCLRCVEYCPVEQTQRTKRGMHD